MTYYEKLELHEKLYGVCAFMDDCEKVDEVNSYLSKHGNRIRKDDFV